MHTYICFMKPEKLTWQSLLHYCCKLDLWLTDLFHTCLGKFKVFSKFTTVTEVDTFSFKWIHGSFTLMRAQNYLINVLLTTGIQMNLLLVSWEEHLDKNNCILNRNIEGKEKNCNEIIFQCCSSLDRKRQWVSLLACGGITLPNNCSICIYLLKKKSVSGAWLELKFWHATKHKKRTTE